MWIEKSKSTQRNYGKVFDGDSHRNKIIFLSRSAELAAVHTWRSRDGHLKIVTNLSCFGVSPLPPCNGGLPQADRKSVLEATARQTRHVNRHQRARVHQE